MAILTLNGAEMPAPATLNIHMEDAGAAVQRALSGKALYERAALKRRIEAYWAYLTNDEMQLLLRHAAQDTPCLMTFPDPLTGETLALNAYSVTRRMELKRMRGSHPVWTGVHVTFVEC